MTYDALNRVTVVKGLWGVTLTFLYDAAGNRTEVRDSFGGVVTSVYDNANRLTQRKLDAGTPELGKKREKEKRKKRGRSSFFAKTRKNAA